MKNIPPIKRFGKGDRVYHQAQQIWLILVAFVMQNGRNPKTIQYGEVAKKMGLSEKAGIILARPLGIIGRYCDLNGLPSLNSIVVNKISGTPGDEVYLRKGYTVRQEQRSVAREDWFKFRVPTTGTFRKVWDLQKVSREK